MAGNEAGVYHSGAPSNQCWSSSLDTNIRLVLNWMAVANTRTYYNMATITCVKIFYNLCAAFTTLRFSCNL
jgi:hypothetical protein